MVVDIRPARLRKLQTMGREEIGLSVLFEIRAGLVEGEGNPGCFALAAKGENPLKVARARALV